MMDFILIFGGLAILALTIQKLKELRDLNK
jgi:hypothetical protein